MTPGKRLGEVGDALLQENGHIPSGKLAFCNGKPPFFIGHTSSFMVDFPASYVGLPEG